MRTTVGLGNRYRRKLQSITNEYNVDLICKFIHAIKTEANISDNYRAIYLSLLSWLSRFHNDTDFKKMKRDDMVAYLEHLRKNEVSDPQHKWIGTYNLHLGMLIRFFKWLYYPDVEPLASHIRC
jgi:site-specific recombinase XerD